MPTLATNKKAFFDYHIEDKFEAGLVLAGHEVKSIRGGQASLTGSYVTIRNGEAFLRNAYIGKYKHASKLDGYDENRERKLLLHRLEILKLTNKEKGLTLVPIELYTSKNRIKLKVGLARGKKQFDKRESIKKKESKRKIDREIRHRI